MEIPHPKTEALTDGTRCLLEDFVVRILPEPSGWVVSVPKGYKTDGASIPRFAWPIVGPPLYVPYFPASIIHDYLCDTADTYEQRVLADAVFFLLLQRLHIEVWRRTVMYLAVRWWGRFTS
jgi:hypothetical protein